MKLTLFYAPAACSLIPYVTLTEAGADFEVRPVNLRAGEQRTPDYIKINPSQKVPVLLIDGKPLTENVAIQLFIARTFPKAQLLPADSMTEIEAVSLMAWMASGVHPHMSRIGAAAKFCDVPDSAESVRRLATEQLLGAFKVANARLKGREYFFDHYTSPDAYFFWCFKRAASLDVPLSQFENCSAHFERMKARPSGQKALAFEKDVAATFAKAS